MKLKIEILLILLSSISIINSANILAVFPTPSYSHQTVFKVLINELAARGHTITVLAPFIGNYKNSNVTEIDISASNTLNKMNLNWNDFESMTYEEAVINANYWKFENHKNQLKIPKVQELITNSNNYKFDLMILEYFNHITHLAFAELYKCPVVGISSQDPYIYVHEEFGNAANPLVEPDFYTPYLHGDLSFFERLRSLIFYLNLKLYLQPQQEGKYEKLIKEFFPNNTESIGELKERVQLMMINSSPILKNRPLAANVITLGNLHIEPPKEITDFELKNFLDHSKHGVIYISFGSYVKSEILNEKNLETLLKVFRSIKYDVVWKFEGKLANKPENVFISKWLPQADLLAHPKIKLFITQCGLQSMEEAIDRNVPLIAIPFILDQKLNAKVVEKKKIGVKLDLKELSEEKLIAAIEEVTKPFYKENAANIKKLINDQPMSSREKAVWWIEYVLRNNNLTQLKYPARLMPIYQRCGFDIIAMIIVVFLILWKVIKFLKTFFARKIKKVKIQ